MSSLRLRISGSNGLLKQVRIRIMIRVRVRVKFEMEMTRRNDLVCEQYCNEI